MKIKLGVLVVKIEKHVTLKKGSVFGHRGCSNFGLSEIVVDVVIVIFQPRHGQSVVSHLLKFALEVLLEKINLDEVAKELVCFVFSRLRRSEIKTHLRFVICVTAYVMSSSPIVYLGPRPLRSWS